MSANPKRLHLVRFADLESRLRPSHDAVICSFTHSSTDLTSVVFFFTFFSLVCKRGATHNGYAVSPEADSALSQFFEKSVRLVRKGDTQRWPGLDPLKQSSPTAPSGWVPADFPIGKSQWNLNKAFTRWQDFYPLLIGTETSIGHIRKTLVKTVHPPETPPESDNESSGDMNRPGVYGEKQGDFVHSYPVPKKLNKEEWGGEPGFQS